VLQIVIEFGVPTGLFLLMLVTGTEIRMEHLRTVHKATKLLMLGTLGQLVLIPLTALIIVHVATPSAIIAACLLLLAMSPGGGISNYYCYVGRLNIVSSAAITSIGTLFSLVTIPIFLTIISARGMQFAAFAAVPIDKVTVQLIVFMIFPMTIGTLVRRKLSAVVEIYGGHLRRISQLIVLVVLALTLLSARASIQAYFYQIASFAILFISAAMMIGHLLGSRLSSNDRSVLIIEAGTRNIGVALLLGSNVLAPAALPTFAGFLSVYFLSEVVIMLLYARNIARRRIVHMEFDASAS
jgi:BASS family bile acid:Na+ symporter